MRSVVLFPWQTDGYMQQSLTPFTQVPCGEGTRAGMSLTQLQLSTWQRYCIVLDVFSFLAKMHRTEADMHKPNLEQSCSGFP